MTWLEHHERSERLAGEAESVRAKDAARAREIYERAASEEEQALADLDRSKTRTFGITVVSAVSLYFKASEFRIAESLAHRSLTEQGLPAFAREDLRLLLQSIWSEEARQASDLEFAPGEVVISVRGGQVVQGGAPLELILDKATTVQSLFYRTAEWLKRRPHRTRGGPGKDIREMFRPWLFQTAPGSYQFAVAVEAPQQGSLFQTGEPTPADLAGEFLRIVRASAEAPEEDLPAIVTDPTYRSTILKLTRNLAPTGKIFSQLEIRGTSGGAVTLIPETRGTVSRALRATAPSPPIEGRHEELRGVLRAVHLDKDWIEVTSEGDHVRIDRVGEAVDDVIGPMVNHQVIVQTRVDSKGRHFVDIEAEE